MTRSPSPQRVWCRVVGLAVCFAGLLVPATASAWSISRDGTRLTVTDGAGSSAFVVDRDAGGSVVLEDTGGFDGDLPAQCAVDVDGDGFVHCSEVDAVSVLGNDGDDDLAMVGGVTGTLDGGAGADTLRGGDAGQTLVGGSGDDDLDGGAGADMVTGDDGDDQLAGGAGADVLGGGAGSDQIDGGADDDQIDGGDGGDTVDAGDGADQVEGGAGADSINGDAGDDILHGGDGDDTVDGGAGTNSIFGDGGADTLAAGDGHDTIDGGAGSDVLSANHFGSVLRGADGDDVLQGAEGRDQLEGGSGDDTLTGDAGDDVLDGGSGDDQLDGGDGSNAVSGGDGLDIVTFQSSGAGVAVSLDGIANDGVAGQTGNVSDDIETIQGSEGDDRLAAGAHAVALLGGGGNDVLVGGPSADVLHGGAGDDMLDGAGGPDKLFGDEDVDTLTYGSRGAPVAVTLGNEVADDGAAGEGDMADASIENVIGTAGADRLVGAVNVPNVLVGGGGDDILLLRSSDAEPDQAQCGDGTDRAELDSLDVEANDCENVFVDGIQTRFGLASLNRPNFFLLRPRVKIGREGAVTVLLRCAATTLVRCSGRLAIRRADGLSFGHASFSILSGSAKGIRVRVPHETLRRLRKRRPVHAKTVLAVTATDAAHRRGTLRRAFYITYPQR
jgi:Ca2+-binding RTX toxin-like protein